MNQKIKRIVSLLLAFAMVIGMLPTNKVKAAETTLTNPAQIKVTKTWDGAALSTGETRPDIYIQLIDANDQVVETQQLIDDSAEFYLPEGTDLSGYRVKEVNQDGTAWSANGYTAGEPVELASTYSNPMTDFEGTFYGMIGGDGHLKIANDFVALDALCINVTKTFPQYGTSAYYDKASEPVQELVLNPFLNQDFETRMKQVIYYATQNRDALLADIPNTMTADTKFYYLLQGASWYLADSDIEFTGLKDMITDPGTITALEDSIVTAIENSVNVTPDQYNQVQLGVFSPADAQYQNIITYSFGNITGRAIGITNTKVAPAPIPVNLTANKTLTGATLEAGQFNFTLTETTNGVNTLKEEKTNDTNGLVEFSTFTLSEPGVYTYEIKEVAGTVEGMTYDSSVVKATVEVAKNASGVYVATVTYENADNTFENSFTPVVKPVEVTFSKADIYGKELPGAEITVLDANGEVVSSWVSTSTPKKITLPAGNYTMHEVAAPNGYVVATDITFTVNADGTVTGTGSEAASVNGTVVKMVDDFASTQPTITKKINETLDHKEIGHEAPYNYDIKTQVPSDFSTYKNFVITDTVDARINVTSAQMMNYSSAFDVVVTPNLDGTTTVVATLKDFEAVKGATEFHLQINANIKANQAAELIPNKASLTWTDTAGDNGSSETPEVTVIPSFLNVSFNKVWSPQAPQDAQVTVKLYANGKPAAEVLTAPEYAKAIADITLNGTETTPWAGMFTNLPAKDKTDTAIVYTVGEVTVPGYTKAVTGNQSIGYTLTNTQITTNVKISKVDATSMEELPGATLEISGGSLTTPITWVSSTTPKEVTLAPGSYTLKETIAPQGYEIATTINFTVDLDGKVTSDSKIISIDPNTIVMEDTLKPIVPTDVTISKQDITNGAELPGAQLTVTKADGTQVATWESTSTKKVITLEAGDYTLTEVTAPNGYQVAEAINFTVTKDNKVLVNGGEVKEVVMKDAKETVVVTNVTISKQDITNSQELPGAHLTVTKEDGTVVADWTSTSTSRVITLDAGNYTLTEVTAPAGYNVAEVINFTVNADQTVSVNGQTVASNTVVMKDAPIEVAVNISKVDIANSQELPGAQLIVKDSDGNTVKSWTSTTVPTQMILNPGTYTLTEVTAPKGYEVAETITFVVNDDMTVSVNGSVVGGNTVVMKDALIEASVKISKQDITNSQELPGAVLTIEGANLESPITWRSSTVPNTVVLKPGTYTLTEITAPDGYLVAETITFVVNQDKTVSVDGSTVDSNTVVMKDAPIVPTDVTVSKQDITNGQELPGAELTVKDSKGNVVETWTSTTDKHVITLEAGDYTLTEVTAPAGYQVAETINFTVTVDNKILVNGGEVSQVVMKDAPEDVTVTNVTISKQDLTNSKELPGAELTVKKKDGTVVANWISTSTSREITLAEGTYTLTEVTAPNGYKVAETITFSVTADHKVTINGSVIEDNTVIMKDAPIEVAVKISKEDITNSKELAGAELTVKDVNGNVVETWVSKTTPKDITLRPGTYTLTEVTAPQGYEVAEVITFVVKDDMTVTVDGQVVDANTVVMFDAPTPVVPTDVTISKQDITNGAELPGAQLIVKDQDGKEVESWISTTVPHKTQLVPGTYTLTEITAPQGYEVAETITFVVNSDNTVSVGGTTVDSNTVVMKDAPTPQGPTDVTISKVDITNGQELPGAQLTVKDSKGNVVETWTSTTDKHVITLEAGDYSLTEVTAPDGYQVAETIYFTVTPNNKVLVNGGEVNEVLMKDAPEAVVVTKVTISKQDITNGAELPGAHLTVTREDGTVVADWTSTSTKREITLEAGNYTLTEVTAPQGFEVAESIKFTVNEDQTVSVNGSQVSEVVMKDAPSEVTVKVSKVDVIGKELPGAALEISGGNLQAPLTWISTTVAHEVKLTAGHYTLTEKIAPEGYEIATSISFEVGKDGTVTTTSGISSTDPNTIIMEDDYSSHKVDFSKVDIEGKELPGASVEVRDENGKVVESWTSSDKPHALNLKPGTYTYVETFAPEGYEVATTITFTVNPDGTVTRDGVTVDGNTVVMIDDYKYTEVAISKVDMTNKEELAGAELTIKDETGKEVEKWTSTNEKHMVSLKFGKYTLTEVTAPNGYKVAETISFEVTKDGKVLVNGQEVKDGVVVMEDERIPEKTVTVKPNKPSNEKPSKPSTKPSDKPNTGDLSLAAYASVMLLAAAGYVTMKKKENK